MWRLLPVGEESTSHRHAHLERMTFYFKPPRGNVTLHILQECISERLRYLSYIENVEDISACEEPFKFQYLTDGSALDRAGHFMLRLISLQLSSLKEFLLHRETMLYEKRLKCIDAVKIRSELRVVLRHISEIKSVGGCLPKYEQFLGTFQQVCDFIVQRSVGTHAFGQHHSPECEQYVISVPFTMCLHLVKLREVKLHQGSAVIPCGKWRALLSEFFYLHLKLGLEQLQVSMSYYDACQDERLQCLVKTCTRWSRDLRNDREIPHQALMSQDVDGQSHFFPPCMTSLYKALRKRHRLSHYSRLHLSLFLKDLGMPWNEAVTFWRQEYIQSHSGCATCTHSWQKDGKRYLYGIRHLYGLEGSRREYHTPSCRQLQDRSLSQSAEGGCPFIHCDDSVLTRTFSNCVSSDRSAMEAIVQLKATGKALAACQLYLNTLVKSMSLDSNSDSTQRENIKLSPTPLTFYSAMKSAAEKSRSCNT